MQPGHWQSGSHRFGSPRKSFRYSRADPLDVLSRASTWDDYQCVPPAEYTYRQEANRGSVRHTPHHLGLSTCKLKKAMSDLKDKTYKGETALISTTTSSAQVSVGPGQGSSLYRPRVDVYGASQSQIPRSCRLKSSSTSLRTDLFRTPSKSLPCTKLSRTFSAELSIFESDSDASTHGVVAATKRFLKKASKVRGITR